MLLESMNSHINRPLVVADVSNLGLLNQFRVFVMRIAMSFVSAISLECGIVVEVHRYPVIEGRAFNNLRANNNVADSLDAADVLFHFLQYPLNRSSRCLRLELQ